MITKMTATEAKAKLLSVLDDVESGQAVEITRRGRTIARIVPAAGPHALKGSLAAEVETLTDDERDLFTTGLSWELE